MKLTKALKNALTENGIPFTSIPTEKGNLTDRIVMPDGGLMTLPLKQGNTKTGRKCYGFSTLATDRIYLIPHINVITEVKGTCSLTCTDCDGKDTCYGTKGHYTHMNVKVALANNTILAYYYLDFLYRLLKAQLSTFKPGTIVRIHITGDFFSIAYVEMWKTLIQEFPALRFWSYTKTEYENAFDDLKNANIVKSNIAGFGFNYGHIDYLLSLYIFLAESGKKPYICPCGVDDTKHCTDCKVCLDYEYVLFIEHSTDYDAKADALYPFICEIVNAQTGNNQNELVARIYAALMEKAA